MRKISVVLALLALLACGKKDKDKDAGKAGAGGSAAAVKPVDQPVTCPPGNVVKDGACVAVITAEKIAVVEQQRSRLDELAALLDRVDAVATPVDLMGAFRQLEQWQTLAAKNDKFKMLDEIVASLDTAVKQLRVFKGSLGQASAQLGNLKGELDRLLTETGTAKRIEDVRAQISSQIRSTVKPFADDVTQTIRGALAPLELRFDDASNLITLGCAALALGRAGDQSKQLCKQATEAFAQGKKYLEELKAKPAALFEEVTAKLETELEALIDDQAKQLLDTAQTAVNDALKLPPAAAAGGSAAPGSPAPGSAAKP